MADTYLNYMGKLIKLVDNGDNTYSIAAATSAPPGAASEEKQDAIIDFLDEISGFAEGVEANLVTLNGKIMTEQASSFAQVTVNATAVALPTVPNEAKKALISIEINGIRWRIDGVDPTPTVGQPALKDDIIVLSSNADITRFRAIRSGDADAALSVTYFA